MLTSDSQQVFKLSIGALPTASSDLLPAAALAFSKRYPNARLHVLTGLNWLLFNQLRQGALDLVVGRMPEGGSEEGVSFEQLYIEDVVLVCHQKHPLLRGRLGEQITDFPVIMPPKVRLLPGPLIAF